MAWRGALIASYPFVGVEAGLLDAAGAAALDRYYIGAQARE